MKKITFCADEQIIRQAKVVARTRGKSFNTAFREWLAEFTGLSEQAKKDAPRACQSRPTRHPSRNECTLGIVWKN
jgi:hypothetical protein